MAKTRNKFFDYLVYLALRVFTMLIHMFPQRTNYITARLIGKCLYHIDRRHRKMAIDHLKLSFPDWPEVEYHRVAKASMRSLVYLGLEVLFTTRLITPTRWRRYARLANQRENIRLLVERKTPLIYVTGHFGNWEVIGYTLATLGFDSYAVARPLDNPYINEYIMGVRQKTGLAILDKKGATQSMDDILSANGVISFIADQDAGRKGMFVDFFGRPASTYKSIGLMAMRYNAPVIIGYGQRINEEFNFEIGVEQIIYPHQWADKDDPLRWITQEYTSALERIIRRAPGQYLWVHRRWKHRPKGQQPGPDGVA